MTIAGAAGKFKGKSKWLLGSLKALGGRIPRDALILGVLVAASLGSFGFGYLAGRDAGEAATPLSIEVAPGAGEASAASASLESSGTAGQGSGQFVASKNGAKYYLTSCSGAKRISEANKVYFDSAAAAAAAGYAPAANCPGL